MAGDLPGRPLDESDEGLHLDDFSGLPTWQENMFFSGYDFEADAGFAVHVKLHPGQGVAAVRAQVMLEGTSAGLTARHRLQPGLEYPDLAVEVLDTFRSHRLRLRGAGRSMAQTAGYYGLEHDAPPTLDVGIALELTSPLVPMDWATMMADTPVGGTGDGHYDQGFAFAGELRIGERRVVAEGRGWRDHSWGLRNLSSVRVMFVFVTADDLSRQLSAVRVNLPDGQTGGFAFVGDHERVQVLGQPATEVVEGVEEPSKYFTIESDVGGIFVTSRVRAHGNLLLVPENYLAGQGHAEAEFKGGGTGYGYFEVGASLSPSEVEAITSAAGAVH